MEAGTFIALMYHDLDESSRGSYTLSWHTFTAHLDYLQDAGFVLEGFGGLERRLGTRDWPARYAVITFDDGYRSFLRAADILAGRGAQATFFLTRDLCRRRPDFLRDSEIRELAARSEVGCHGATHAPLSELPRQRARQEIVESRQWLGDLAGREIRYMSAPRGFWNRASQRMAREAGYGLVGNSVERWNSPGQVALSRQVNRVGLRVEFGPAEFARIVAQDRRLFLTRRLRAMVLALPKVVWARWAIWHRRSRYEW